MMVVESWCSNSQHAELKSSTSTGYQPAMGMQIIACAAASILAEGFMLDNVGKLSSESSCKPSGRCCGSPLEG